MYVIECYRNHIVSQICYKYFKHIQYFIIVFKRLSLSLSYFNRCIVELFLINFKSKFMHFTNTQYSIHLVKMIGHCNINVN